MQPGRSSREYCSTPTWSCDRRWTLSRNPSSGNTAPAPYLYHHLILNSMDALAVSLSRLRTAIGKTIRVQGWPDIPQRHAPNRISPSDGALNPRPGPKQRPAVLKFQITVCWMIFHLALQIFIKFLFQGLSAYNRPDNNARWLLGANSRVL